MAVSATESSLPRLLIISAIDLLLCCFTMGVMLFLVFQPSLRPDRASALSRHLSVSAQQAEGIAALTAPVMLIIRNKLDNPLQPISSTSEFTRVPAEKVRQTPALIVLTAQAASNLSSLTLRSNMSGRATSVDILLGVQNTIQNETLTCEGDAEIEIDFFKPAVVKRCLPTIRTCSIDAVAGANGNKTAFNVSEYVLHNAHPPLVIWPPKTAPEFKPDAYDLCVIERDGISAAQRLAYAQQCGVHATQTVMLLPAQIGECVATKFMQNTHKDTLTAMCGPPSSWNWKGDHALSAVLLAIRKQSSAENDCMNLAIKVAPP